MGSRHPDTSASHSPTQWPIYFSVSLVPQGSPLSPQARLGAFSPGHPNSDYFLVQTQAVLALLSLWPLMLLLLLQLLADLSPPLDLQALLREQHGSVPLELQLSGQGLHRAAVQQHS